jgi:UDPglucose--hexose-1-phosphate uridylyltransferase
MSEIRFDRLQNSYVIIAPERQHRPNIPKNESLDSSKKCPFCEGNENLTPNEIFAIRDNGANEKGWETRVVPNLYKAVQIETEAISYREGMFEAFEGFGAHEVIVDTPHHHATMADLKSEGIEKWLRTIIVRMLDLQKDQRIISLHLFKNSGRSAGATQAHPHSQLIALPIMPQKRLEFLKRNSDYYHMHGRGIVADLVFNEKREKKRVIIETQNFIAYAPYASFFAFEVIVAPKKVISTLYKCSREEIKELSELLHRLFTQLKEQLGEFAFNLAFYVAPLNENFENEAYMDDIDKNFTFYIRVMPRIYTLGGFELSTEIAINSVPPEMVAKLLRDEAL